MIRGRARAGCWQSCGSSQTIQRTLSTCRVYDACKVLEPRRAQKRGGEGGEGRKSGCFRRSEENQKAIKQTNEGKILQMSGKARSRVGECVANERRGGV